MILQALGNYYLRKAADPQSGLAPEGFEAKAIPFVLVLAADGHLVQLADRREGSGKKKEARVELVPQGVKKTSGVAANLLWDSAEYVLGVGRGSEPERLAKQRAAFAQRFADTFGDDPQDPGLRAVALFLKEQRFAAVALLTDDPSWTEIVDSKPVLSFQLLGDTTLVCQRPAVIGALRAIASADDMPFGICLVSGESDAIERLHPAIKGVWGAQTSGANIVSFNLAAFASYGKQQSFNAPVGRRAVFSYSTALNHLLRKGSRQRLQVGDASTVFWAEKTSGTSFEVAFLDFLDPRPDDPDVNTQAVASLYAAVRVGRPFTADDGQRFHVLGLSPNAARIAIRFWHVASIADLGGAFVRYFDDLAIDRPAYAATAPLSLYRLLASTALLGKAENVPPKLAGDMMRAILNRLPYPVALLQSALRRIRAERDVGLPRAALLKAYLNRNLEDKEITVSLNPANKAPGYRLGRLFAVLERVQERAQGKLNAGIRDRYYGAFSTTPTTVLPILMKLKNHHLAKLANRGEAVNLEKLLAEVVDGLDDVPPRLHLAEQARFAVGYYHQRQAFFGKGEAAHHDTSLSLSAE